MSEFHLHREVDFIEVVVLNLEVNPVFAVDCGNADMIRAIGACQVR